MILAMDVGYKLKQILRQQDLLLGREFHDGAMHHEPTQSTGDLL